MLGSRVRAPEGAHLLKANSVNDTELALICVWKLPIFFIALLSGALVRIKRISCFIDIYPVAHAYLRECDIVAIYDCTEFV